MKKTFKKKTYTSRGGGLPNGPTHYIGWAPCIWILIRWVLPMDCVILLLVLALLCYCCSSRSVSCVSFFSCVWMPLVYLLTVLIICSVPRWLASFVSACFDVWCRPLFSALLYFFIVFSLPDCFVLFVSFLLIVFFWSVFSLLARILHWYCCLCVCFSLPFLFSTLSSYLSSFGFIPSSILPLCFPSFLLFSLPLPVFLLLYLYYNYLNICSYLLLLLKIPFPTTLEWCKNLVNNGG